MNERWRRLNANMRQYVPIRANMGQHCSLSAVQRKTAFVEQSWLPEFDTFGSMPWCSFPWHKLLPRLTQNNFYIFYAVYSLNLIHEFDEGEFCTFAWKAFPPKQGFVDIRWHQCFCVVAQAAAKIRPRPAQWLFSKERTWWNNWTHCSNECWMKGGEGWVCWVQLANMWQHCSLTAVQRKTPFVEESWWPEFKLFGCHGVRSLGTSSSQGWRKIIVIQSTV